MFKKIKMWFEKRNCEKKSSTKNADDQHFKIGKGVVHLNIPEVKPPMPTAPAQPPQQKVVNNYVSITIDGKTYDTSNQEEIAEILKYFSEQLRAKK